jgi:hypothetical protein
MRTANAQMTYDKGCMLCLEDRAKLLRVLAEVRNNFEIFRLQVSDGADFGTVQIGKVLVIVMC